MGLLNSITRDVWRCEKYPLLQKLHQNIRVGRYEEEIRRLRRDTDIFLISYPKSGRTWHRFLLGHYLTLVLGLPIAKTQKTAKLTGHNPGGLTRYNHDAANFIDAIPPQHPIVATPELWAGRKVIFLVRDPRDVIVSCWFHAHYRQKTYSGTMQEFIRSPGAGIEKILAAHNKWWKNRNLASDLMITSYERIFKDPGKVLRDTLHFIGNWPIDEKFIAESVQAGSFENMRDVETKGIVQHHSLQQSLDPRALKTREGKIGGFRNHLSGEDLAYVEDCIKRIGDPFAPYYKPE
ncbi:MAG TPA: sulfotransferase domain-containing protein [Xanthobacteraceae bacterium]|nr:sulfotransferase domain-containing protein [Xanthobacteraceae bacterium]